LDKLRHLIAAYLAHHQVCVLSVNEVPSTDEAVMPVRYRPLTGTGGGELELECLVPRWADIAYHLEQRRTVNIVVLACYVAGLRWLQYQGVSHPVAAPDWGIWLPHWMSATPPDELYLVIHVRPEHVTIFDEAYGWGAREALEFNAEDSPRVLAEWMKETRLVI